MPNRLSFDELNALPDGELIDILEKFHIDRNGGNQPKPRKKRHMPYREFFGDMYLDPEEKEKRIRMAEDLEHVFLVLFALLATYGGIAEDLTYSSLYRNVENSYWNVVEKYIDPDDGNGFTPPKLSPRSRAALENSIRDYIARQTRNVVDATADHFEDDYFTSDDRAKVIAENQTNGVGNNTEMHEAFDAGFTHKTWVTMKDRYVRETHQEVDDVTILIDEPFLVGDSQMLFPGDDSMGAGAEEIVGCRCTVEYSSLDQGEQQ